MSGLVAASHFLRVITINTFSFFIKFKTLLFTRAFYL